MVSMKEQNDKCEEFWYKLGKEIGGPLYTGLYRYMSEIVLKKEQRVYFLSPGGYILYRIFKMLGFDNVEYIYINQSLLESADYNREEKQRMMRYLDKTEIFKQDGICFDYDWEGNCQSILEQIKEEKEIDTKHLFVHFGIRNTDKSRKQLRGFEYKTFFCDFYTNYTLQYDVETSCAVYDLFFLNAEGTCIAYDEEGMPVTEQKEETQQALLKGILDYVVEYIENDMEQEEGYLPEISVQKLKRLIHFPTDEEAFYIGKFFEKKKIDMGSCWLEGLLARVDVSEETKKEWAKKAGTVYPKEEMPYHLEDEQTLRNYHRWLRYQKKEPDKDLELEYKPIFSVVIPVYNTVTEQLEECIESVLAQTYDNYELILVDDHSSWDNVVPVLQRYEKRDKVRVIYRSENGHISIATNDGIRETTGDYIVFMDCDDTIEPEAFYEFAKKLNEDPQLDFIYSDEDKITEDGKIRHMAFFKPDWSPDLYLNMNYTNHLSIYRASIVKEVGGLRTAYNGSQDYDFTLRFMEKSDNRRVGHIPKILYHWRERKESAAYAISAKNYAADAARDAKQDYIKRNGLKAHLEYITGMTQYRIIYEVEGEPLVSIIIPSKDQPEILKQCIDSVKKFTDYSNYEILVVDNGSNDDNRALIEKYLAAMDVKYIYEKQEFNFSRMCNIGASHAAGDYLLFLNDDIEMFQSTWLERMLGQAQQRHVGAVGAKLFYPGTSILQHSGVFNPAEGPAHRFVRCDDRYSHYFGCNWVDGDCIAVTGACLLVEKDKFNEIGGFDEKLAVTYNDVKLCFALHSKGYYNVQRNDAVAYHHESLSRGQDFMDDQKLMRLCWEREKLYAEFEELKNKDPYLNENLHNMFEDLDLKLCYDKLDIMDLAGCEAVQNATIDAINVGEKITIRGWSVLEGEKHIEQLERYIVFRDVYGKTYGARVFAGRRDDLVTHFQNPHYLYGGFECVLNKNDLRFDLFSYEVGVLTIDRSGRKCLCWCRKTDVVRFPKPRAYALEDKKLDVFIKYPAHNDILWNIDECRHYDGYYRIRGFAFKSGYDHYRYRNSLLLTNSSGETYEFKVQLEERVDVAYSYPKEHFLYNTGFVCYIFDSVLKQGCEYEMIIRLQDQFDESRRYDVTTRQRIKV